jgi:site-specific DNA-methyltransferase (adenine-specific)
MDWKNRLYFGDNLDILRREVPDASVDLIYLDPPFNSSATYNVLFQENTGEESTAVEPRRPGAVPCCPPLA